MKYLIVITIALAFTSCKVEDLRRAVGEATELATDIRKEAKEWNANELKERQERARGEYRAVYDSAGCDAFRNSLKAF